MRGAWNVVSLITGQLVSHNFVGYMRMHELLLLTAKRRKNNSHYNRPNKYVSEKTYEYASSSEEDSDDGSDNDEGATETMVHCSPNGMF
jgi:hypothetical protein